MILLPTLVFVETLGSAPAIVPSHFVGVPTNIVLGIILIVTGIRGLSHKHWSTDIAAKALLSPIEQIDMKRIVAENMLIPQT